MRYGNERRPNRTRRMRERLRALIGASARKLQSLLSKPKHIGAAIARSRASLDRLLGSVISDRRRRARSLRPPGCNLCKRVRQGLTAIGASWRPALERFRRGEAEPGRELVRTFKRRPYAGSRHRRYRVHLPTGYRKNARYPLVMVLHGCLQTEQDIRQITGFDPVADERGFVVVYPFVTSYTGLRSRNCWGWWFQKEIHRGAGEVEDLWQIVEEVCRDHAIERKRIHVAGLSSGAGMAVAMMVNRARWIASGAVVAGVPYAESAGAVRMLRVMRAWFKPIDEVCRAMDRAMGEERRLVPVFIIHSDGDETVPLQASLNIRDSWRACFRLPMGGPSKRTVGTTRGTPWERCEYRDAEQSPVIETLFVSGKGHGWYGGNPGAFSYPDAPEITPMIWDFFSRHALAKAAKQSDAAA